MDFRQDKLAGCTRKEFDKNGNLVRFQQTDFTTSPWTERVFSADGDLLDEYHIGLDKSQPAGQQVIRLD